MAKYRQWKPNELNKKIFLILNKNVGYNFNCKVWLFDSVILIIIGILLIIKH